MYTHTQIVCTTGAPSTEVDEETVEGVREVERLVRRDRVGQVGDA